MARKTQTSNAYPFGSVLGGRNGNTSVYRYSFQNQETDAEVKGAGNSVNFEYRMHDPRLGRFLSIDPLAAKYPNYSTYSFAGNKPIWARELEGLEEWYTNNGNQQGGDPNGGPVSEQAGPLSEEYAASQELISGSTPISEVGKNMSVYIKAGKVERGLDKESKRENFKNEGGLSGGHAMIITDEGVFGFSGPTTLFGKSGEFQDTRSAEETKEIYEGNLMFEFPLTNVTLDQYYSLVNYYINLDKKQNLLSKKATGEISFVYSGQYLNTPSYHYAITGYRCASSCLRSLRASGIIEISTFSMKYFHGSNPNALIRYLINKGYDYEKTKDNNLDPNYMYNKLFVITNLINR